MSLTADEMFMKCGGLGRFQIRILVLLAILILPSAFITYMPMFVLTIPNHRCALENLHNDTYAVQSPAHLAMINASIPWEDEEGGVLSTCQRYSSQVFDNGTRKIEECSRFVYDQSFFRNSFIEKFDVVCDNLYLRSTANSMMMAGKMLASISQGFFSDIFGRRKSVLALIVVTIIVSASTAFPFNIPSLLVSRLAAGFCTSSLYLAVYVSALEFLIPQYRRIFSVIWAVVWVLGGLILTSVAYFIRDSQQLILSLSVPLVFLLSYYWLLPESPRWLLSKGKMKEARESFEYIAKTNGKEFPSEFFEEVVAKLLDGDKKGEEDTPEGEEGVVVVEEVSGKENLLSLLRYKLLAFHFGILVFNWIANSMTYYALMFNVSNLSGSIYLNFLLLNLVDGVSNVSSYVVLERFGRKWSYAGFMLIATLGCLLCMIPIFFIGGPDSPVIFNALALIGRAGISTSFSIIYLFSSELFPTSVRNSSLGVFAMSSKIGSFFSPYIADVGLLIGGHFKEVLPMVVCGGVALTALVLSLFLPETVGKDLPNTIADSLRANKIADKKYKKCPQPQSEMKFPESDKV